MYRSRPAQLSLMLFGFLAALRPVAGQVTTAQYGNARIGVAATETILTPANVRPDRFGRVASYPVDGPVYAQPLYLPRTDWAGHPATAALFVATEHGSVYAFDAGGSGTDPIWQRAFIDAANGVTAVPARDVGCPFLAPEIGITSTPVIDPAAGTLYVLMRTREPGHSGAYRYVQRLHALDLRDGHDRIPPVAIDAQAPGSCDGSDGGVIAFDPLRENPRAALLLAKGVVSLAWGSSCDVGPYHGWVMAYDSRTLQQLGALNVSPNGSAAGIWQGDAGLAADSAGNVFVVTGNGSFDDGRTPGDYGNTVLKLGLTQSGFVVRDYFTPSEQAALSGSDEDLGSSGPILLSDQAGTHRRLLFVAGKNGKSFLIDRDAMGHFHCDNNAHAVQVLTTSLGGFGASAFWHHTLYVWGSDSTLLAYPLRGGRIKGPPISATVRSTDPGAVPVISANGDRAGIVWAIETRTWQGDEHAAILHAFDALDVRHELFNSEMKGSRDRAGEGTRFAIPTVAGGRVFVGGRDRVDVYGLLGEGPRP